MKIVSWSFKAFKRSYSYAPSGDTGFHYLTKNKLVKIKILLTESSQDLPKNVKRVIVHGTLRDFKRLNGTSKDFFDSDAKS